MAYKDIKFEEFFLTMKNKQNFHQVE